MFLSEIKQGKLCEIKNISPELNVGQKILDMGFVPGTKVKMIRNAPFMDPVKFSIRGYLVSIRRAEANLIEVKFCE